MLNKASNETAFRAGDPVYLRCRVVGFDGKTDNKGMPRVALQLIEKNGEPATDVWYYVDAANLIDGRVVKQELQR